MAELDNQRRRLVSLIAKKNDQRKLVSQIASKPDDRITIRETDDGMGIHNPSRRFMPLIIFLLLWLGGWGVGEFFALNEILSGGFIFADLFLIFWVTFWTIGGIAVWGVALYQLFGVEQLFITSGAVVHEIGLWKFRRRKVFPIETVSNFRLGTSIPGAKGEKATKGKITFDASGKPHGFGVGMDEDEAKLALAAIERHLSLSAAAVAVEAQPGA